MQLGLSCMQAIYEVGGRLDLVMTLPDDKAIRKSGRVYLDDFCAERGIPLIKSGHVNNLEVVEGVRSAAIDWLFIVGWSQIASPEVLDSPRMGVLGMHPTLLPEGRGRAAIPWAILKGLDKTGVTLFKMDAGLDSGPVIAQVEIPLARDVNATALYSLVEAAHVELIRQVVPRISACGVSCTPQDESLATFWPGRRPEDGQIDLNGSVYDAERQVRALTRPYPGAFFLQNGVKHVVWSARIVVNGSPMGGNEKLVVFRDGVLLIEDSETQIGQHNS